MIGFVFQGHSLCHREKCHVIVCGFRSQFPPPPRFSEEMFVFGGNVSARFWGRLFLFLFEVKLMSFILPIQQRFPPVASRGRSGAAVAKSGGRV